MSSLVQPVASTLLASLPTKRLLSLRDKLLRCEDSLEQSDVEDLGEIDPSVIRFKDDPRWAEMYAAVRSILATREHVPRRALKRRDPP